MMKITIILLVLAQPLLSQSYSKTNLSLYLDSPWQSIDTTNQTNISWKNQHSLTEQMMGEDSTSKTHSQCSLAIQNTLKTIKYCTASNIVKQSAKTNNIAQMEITRWIVTVNYVDKSKLSHTITDITNMEKYLERLKPNVEILSVVLNPIYRKN